MKYLGISPIVFITPGSAQSPNKKPLIKPQLLNKGDTVGLITPSSAPFEMPYAIGEAREKMQNLGFKVKFGAHTNKRRGYLAGTDEERVEDIHSMFDDDEVRAIIAIRGGYGATRLLKYLDYKLIRSNPKIFLGYSDVTALLLAIHKLSGIPTFHGPVAISTYTAYTQEYFYKALTQNQAVGEIADAPYEENLQTTNRTVSVCKGIARGPLIGGNLTLICSTLGTPYEIETRGKILFIEDVGEEPHDLDRYLTHLDNAGKLEVCAGIVFDRMKGVHPADFKPGYHSNLSMSQIIFDRITPYNIPCAMGLSLGHIANKPTLPLGIAAEIDANKGRISILESAVQ
jgi:muramoyltetrapeptide carboxypeptidase